MLIPDQIYNPESVCTYNFEFILYFLSGVTTPLPFHAFRTCQQDTFTFYFFIPHPYLTVLFILIHLIADLYNYLCYHETATYSAPKVPFPHNTAHLSYTQKSSILYTETNVTIVAI